MHPPAVVGVWGGLLGRGVVVPCVRFCFPPLRRPQKVLCLSGDLSAHLFSRFSSADCGKYLIIAKLLFQKLQLED